MKKILNYAYNYYFSVDIIFRFLDEGIIIPFSSNKDQNSILLGTGN